VLNFVNRQSVEQEAAIIEGNDADHDRHMIAALNGKLRRDTKLDCTAGSQFRARKVGNTKSYSISFGPGPPRQGARDDFHPERRRIITAHDGTAPHHEAICSLRKAQDRQTAVQCDSRYGPTLDADPTSAVTARAPHESLPPHQPPAAWR